MAESINMSETLALKNIPQISVDFIVKNYKVFTSKYTQKLKDLKELSSTTDEARKQKKLEIQKREEEAAKQKQLLQEQEKLKRENEEKARQEKLAIETKKIDAIRIENEKQAQEKLAKQLENDKTAKLESIGIKTKLEQLTNLSSQLNDCEVEIKDGEFKESIIEKITEITDLFNSSNAKLVDIRNKINAATTIAELTKITYNEGSEGGEYADNIAKIETFIKEHTPTVSINIIRNLPEYNKVYSLLKSIVESNKYSKKTDVSSNSSTFEKNKTQIEDMKAQLIREGNTGENVEKLITILAIVFQIEMSRTKPNADPLFNLLPEYINLITGLESNSDIETYKKEFLEFNKTYDDIIKNSKLIQDIYEIILGAARVIIRIKPYKNNNTAPNNISKEERVQYSAKQYESKHPAEREIVGNGGGIMSGGYNYEDVITIDGKKLTIGNEFCKDTLENVSDSTETTTYGPFSGIYPPEYNNFHIYANMFGTDKLSELESKTTAAGLVAEGESSSKDKLNINLLNDTGISKSKYNVENNRQKLMEKISAKGTVVLFGYGMSGSGKTYALIEGLNIDEKYDPSILEQFIKDNSENINSVSFVELYPYGTDNNKKIDKNSENEKITQETLSIYEYEIKAEKGDIPLPRVVSSELRPKTTKRDSGFIGGSIDNMFGGSSASAKASATLKPRPPVNIKSIATVTRSDIKVIKEPILINLYEDLTKSENKPLSYELISKQIKLIERHRIHSLRILPTPNNDKSSRSYLQITINISNGGKLVFFDMPGTENTVRIKSEFIDKKLFNDIKIQKNNSDTISNLDKVDKTIHTIHEVIMNAQDKKASIIKTYLSDTIKDGIYKRSELIDIILKSNKNLGIEFEIPKLNINYSKIYDEITKEDYKFIKKSDGTKLKDFDVSKQINYIFGESNKITIKDIDEQINLYKIPIYSITKLDNYKEDNEQIKKSILLLFKYSITTRTIFNSFDITLNSNFKFDSQISSIGEEICMFLNGKSTSFAELDNNVKINFPKQTFFKAFVQNFIINYLNKGSKYSDVKQLWNVNKSDDDDTIYKKKLEYCPITLKFVEKSVGTTANKKFDNIIINNKNQFKAQFKAIFGINIRFNNDNQIHDYDENSNDIPNFNLTEKNQLYNLTNLFKVKSAKASSSNKKNSELDITKKKLEPSRSLYFANPCIMYIYIIICKLLTHTNTNNSDSPQSASTSDVPTSAINSISSFYKVATFFIYKYIKFIVNQGTAIVSTLEHLKFFFLTRTNNIDDYNTKCLSNAKTQNKAFVFFDDDKDSLLNNPKTYKYDTNIGDSKNPINIEETVNIGNMKTYGLLDILQDLAGNSISYNKTTQPISYNSQQYFTINLFEVDGTTKNSAVFIMFTNLKIFLDKESDKLDVGGLEDKTKGLICGAAYDTLEFAQSISSSTQNDLPSTLQSKSSSKLRISQFFKKNADNQYTKLPQPEITVVGGNLRKFNNKDLRKLEYFNNKRKPKTKRNKMSAKIHKKGKGKTLFSSRSKKYYT